MGLRRFRKFCNFDHNCLHFENADLNNACRSLFTPKSNNSIKGKQLLCFQGTVTTDHTYFPLNSMTYRPGTCLNHRLTVLIGGQINFSWIHNIGIVLVRIVFSRPNKSIIKDLSRSKSNSYSDVVQAKWMTWVTPLPPPPPPLPL